ncbi:MAG TPA: histidine kinase [Streptosporangiaceae bacterium]|nr:histidine kinase [Streptosporangiaceae bacterium]
MTGWVILIAAACVATCIWLRVRRMRTGAPGPTTPRELLQQLGGSFALLVVTLAGFATFDRTLSGGVFLAVSITGMLTVFVLPLARRLLPFALAGIGLAGLGLVLTQANGQIVGYRGVEWWRTTLLLLACGFLAAALWPILRATHRLSRLAGSATGSQYRWGLLLATVLGVIAVLSAPWYSLQWTVAAAAALVVALLVLVPGVVADVASAGLIFLGLGVVALAVHPPLGWVMTSGIPPYYYDPAIGQPLTVLAGVQGAAIVAFGLWLAPRTLGARARLLVRRDVVLAGRVEQLTQTRAEAVDSAGAELRRVERDLHDGAQARLVALGMSLRAAERMVESSPQAALALLAEAREASSRALTELRDLVRGIYPPVLADRGLGDAVRALVLDTPVRAATDIDLPGRLDPPVESACYFAVAEALANAVKHSGARLVQIRIRHSAGRAGSRPRARTGRCPGTLRITVTDDGIGGADPARGTGLQGVERRLATFDGILAVSSPPGGPTMIIMEVPCNLSAPVAAPR